MDKISRFGIIVTKEIQSILASYNIEVSEGYQVFEINEKSENYPLIKSELEKYEPLHYSIAKFSKKEIQNSKYLKISTTSHIGYPQPEDDFQYINKSFNLEKYCDNCGCGAVQNSPLRLKSSIKLRKWHFSQFHWIFDTLITTKEVYGELSMVFQLDYMPILKYKKEEEFENIIQIFPTKEVELEMEDNKYELCPKCGRKKYLPIIEDFFPKIKSDEKELSFAYSKQCFGGGGIDCFKALIINNSFYKIIKDKKYKGLVFKPLKE